MTTRETAERAVVSARTELVSLRDARERAIALLSDAFAHGVIDVDEFDARLTYAHRATTVIDVESLVTDLAEGRETEEISAIFGGVERGGVWAPPRRLRVRAVFGGIVLDLREAILVPGLTEIHVTATFGGVQIVVPPGLSVEVSGSAVLGGFAHLDRAPSRPDPERPLVRVCGRATLGGVAVETRLPGESEGGAPLRRQRLPRMRRGSAHLPV